LKERKSTWTASMTESLARKSVIWLVRLNGAVSHRPGGTLSWPPPLSPNFEIAPTPLSNASVLSVTPSPTPPNSVKQKTTGLSFGGALTGTPPCTRNPLIVVLCHNNTEASVATHRNAKSVLWDAKGVVLGWSNWNWNNPSIPLPPCSVLSTIVRARNWLRYVGCFENGRPMIMNKNVTRLFLFVYVAWFWREWWEKW